MPEKSGFFDTTADDPRSYPAREFAEYFARFIGNGIFGGGTNLKVSATGTDNNVSIATGYAWINGYLYSVFNEPLSLTIPLATNMDRIDRIVLRLNVSTPVRSISAIVLQGTPNTNPTPPALTRAGDIYDISLAQVRMVANEATVRPGNIIDERLNSAVCGIVTGVVDQADTSTIFNEFDAYRQQKQVEFAQSFNAWFATATANFEGDWDTWFAATQQEWNDWFDGAKELLIPDGSVTDIKLSNATGQIKDRFNQHNNDNTRHITAAERTTWNGKANASGTYSGLRAQATTKGDVGLSEVQNYGIATTAQAEAGTASTVYMTPQRTIQAIDSRTRYGVTSGMSTALTLTLSPAPASLYTGMQVTVKLHTNTGTNPTLNVNGLGAKALYDGTDRFKGQSGRVYTFVYDGSNFILLRGGSGGLVKSVQRGTYSMFSGTSSTETVPISTVNPDKCVVFVNVRTQWSNNDSSNYLNVMASIQNANTLQFQRGGSSSVNGAYIDWQLVEYEDYVNVQYGSSSISVGSVDITVSSVDLSRCILTASWRHYGGVNSGYKTIGYSMINNSTIRLTGVEVYATWYLVSW